jgi:hypothetical protein
MPELTHIHVLMTRHNVYYSVEPNVFLNNFRMVRLHHTQRWQCSEKKNTIRASMVPSGRLWHTTLSFYI